MGTCFKHEVFYRYKCPKCEIEEGANQMSHNDGMPEKRPQWKECSKDHEEICDRCADEIWNACHDAFTKYLAERKTMDDRERQKNFEQDIASTGTYIELDGKRIAPEDFYKVAQPTEKNTPEKKLVELSRDEKVKLEAIIYNAMNDDLSAPTIVARICQTFGVPERRVPTVDREDIYAEIAGLTGYLFEKLDPEGKFKVSDQDIKIMNNYTDAIHALFAKTEEKK